MKLQGVDRTILVQSSNIDLGDVLPDYARTSILQMAGKYFGRLNTATVHFNREGPMYRCTVNVQMGALKMISGEAKSADIYAAFRLALERVAKQLRRAKRELREDKAKRVDKHLDWLGSTRSRRRLERGAPGMPARIDRWSNQTPNWTPHATYAPNFVDCARNSACVNQSKQLFFVYVSSYEKLITAKKISLEVVSKKLCCRHCYEPLVGADVLNTMPVDQWTVASRDVV